MGQICPIDISTLISQSVDSCFKGWVVPVVTTGRFGPVVTPGITASCLVMQGSACIQPPFPWLGQMGADKMASCCRSNPLMKRGN